jgi:glyceraldehyde 3-phosphate dehydrogenase
MIKVAINGFGRIGRQVFKNIVEEHPSLEVVAINDLTDINTLKFLLKYDSNYGKYDKEISPKVKFLAEKDPEKLPWKDLKVDIVLECTGLFADADGARKHINAGAKKVIISQPAKDLPGFVLGVNASKYNSENVDIMDMGSCTTNCLAPIAKVLNDNFGIVKGFMTTVHSYTNDQRILDLPHKDLRRARAAGLNMIPTSTGAARAIGKMIPEIDGKLDGIAIRVPTPTVSVLDLTVEVKKSTTKEEVNNIFKKAESLKDYKGILRVEEEPLVSMDFKGDKYSSILDAEQTMVKDNMVKVIGWYDNEWGYSCRLAEFTEFVGKKLKKK